MGSLKGPIILLEDDSDEKELLEEVIRKLKVKNEIKHFTTGEDLIKYLKVTPDKPFVIISDINIPRMSGLEVKKVINGNDFLRKKSIPFIYLSTTSSMDAIESAYDLTAQGFFIKQSSISGIEKHLKLIFEYWTECRHTNSD